MRSADASGRNRGHRPSLSSTRDVSTDPDKARQWQCQFGQRVRSLRLERELSQEALSREVGVHPTYVSGIERFSAAIPGLGERDGVVQGDPCGRRRAYLRSSGEAPAMMASWAANLTISISGPNERASGPVGRSSSTPLSPPSDLV